MTRLLVGQLFQIEVLAIALLILVLDKLYDELSKP